MPKDIHPVASSRPAEASSEIENLYALGLLSKPRKKVKAAKAKASTVAPLPPAADLSSP